MAKSKPFGSIEEFLYAVLTLRSNASYRSDVDVLYKYQQQDPPDNDWVARFGIDDRPFQAARSLIGTWEYICTVATTHFGSAPDTKFFFETAPVASVYAWLKPAIDRVAYESNLGHHYAPNFTKLGKQACGKLLKESPTTFPGVTEVPSDATKPATDFYRTAEQATRPMTHFG